MAQMFDGGVEPQGLQHEQLYRLDRPERAFPPIVTRRLAGRQDRLIRQVILEILLQPLERA
jgi:hypothetical protein